MIGSELIRMQHVMVIGTPQEKYSGFSSGFLNRRVENN